jgi:hypothetical protein
MQLERRALYNLLRMNWQLDPTLEVEDWQIQDYRDLPTDHLFDRLRNFMIDIDRAHFIAIADNCDAVEDLIDYLIGDLNFTTKQEDQIYLLVFELWRRLVPEKPSLSIFCDEIDYQINLFDHGKVKNFEALQDAIANLQSVLDENVDEGAPPHDVFESVSACCAHDIETFLYDFIAEQIDSSSFSYAEELLEGFSPYISDVKWFDFLSAQVLAVSDTEKANVLLRRLVDENSADPEVEFNLELLSFLTREGEKELFLQLAKVTVPRIENEEDFQDLLTTCSDFCHFLDQEEEEAAIQKIAARRQKSSPESAVKANDPDFSALLKLMDQAAQPDKGIGKPLA